MQHSPNPMANLYQSQLAASLRFADAVFSGTEKLDHLVLEAAHRAVSEQLRLAQALADGGNLTDPRTAANLVQRSSGEAVNYQAEIMRVVAEMQGEIGKSMQDYIDQIGTQSERVQEPGTRATREAASGAGDASLYNPVTSVLSMWETAFKEATEMATRNMAAVRSNAERATDAAAGQTRSAARATQHAAEQATEAARKSPGESGDGGGSRRR